MCSELNDTIVEAQLRIRQIPPLLETNEAVDRYLDSNNRLLILVFSPFKLNTKKKQNVVLKLVCILSTS